uniref:Protein p18 n=1 Tax=Spiroplasma citri TaxID=2133 RepID=Q14KL9_SPICI|nr:protein p18 [Spiroplasma citri]
MAITKEQLIEQGLSAEIADNILNEFNNEAKQIRESLQKRTDTISKEEYFKVANELDELKAFKDVRSNKIADIKTNLDKVSGNSLTERMQTLKELKPDLFVQEQQSVSPTNFIKDMIEKSTENKNDEIETIKEKGAYTPDEIKKLTDFTLKNLR